MLGVNGQRRVETACELRESTRGTSTTGSPGVISSFLRTTTSDPFHGIVVVVRKTQQVIPDRGLFADGSVDQLPYDV